MGSITEQLLKTDAPSLEYYMQMNKLYLLLDVNNECYRGQDFSSVTIVVTMYDEDVNGSLDPDAVISTWNRTYARHQIGDRKEPTGFLPYNIVVMIDNHYGDIQLQFTYKSSEDSGGNNYESKISTYPFDNRQTRITGEAMSAFFTGELKDNLQKKNEFNVWFDTLDITDPNSPTDQDYILYDLVSNVNGTIIKQITEINETGQKVQILSTEENYNNLVTYLLKHKYFKAILNEYFGSVPAFGKFTFALFLNRKNYLIHFIGDLRQITT